MPSSPSAPLKSKGWNWNCRSFVLRNQAWVKSHKSLSLGVHPMPDTYQDPVERFAAWFAEAKATPIREPNAMALATVSKDLMPAVRIVLMKQFDQQGLVFYTNFTSA